jgi:broad specificity phosphatase PhoE
MIHLARHGQTAYNSEGRFQGHLPVPLDETGRAQALALADLAARRRWGSLWSSPLERARETAAIVADRVGLEPRIDARFAETYTGDWTDRSFAEVRAEDPDGFAAFQATDAAFRFPGGESYAEHLARVADGLRALRATPGALPALVICHGGSIRLALVAEHGDETARGRPIPNVALVEL